MAKLYGDAFDAEIRIVKRGRGFIEQIKDRSEIELIEFTRNNRDELQEELPQLRANSGLTSAFAEARFGEAGED
jgi:hypothetical protein